MEQTPPPPRRPVMVAPVQGFSAVFLSALLRSHGTEYLRSLERSMRFHPAYLAEVRQLWASIEQAEAEWLAWRASVDGSAEAVPAEGPAASSSEITVKEAADMLRLTTRRVRQLLSEGRLTGRTVGRSWLIDRTSVELHGAARRAA